ncbi:MAG: hypothetical protein ACFFDB_12450 [Promethearchaeota archaeon]
MKNSSALKTRDGVFILDPSNLRRKVPIEEIPRELRIGTGCINLVTWCSV